MTRIRMLLTAALVALPAFASAQQVNQLVEPFRKWDLGGGLGIRFGERDDAVVPAGNWMAEGTRYWTPHVKTSLQVTTAGQTSSYGYQYDPRAFQSLSSQTNTRPAAYGVTTGYQFFDNEFVHPYVSAGVRFASVHTVTTVQSLRPPYLAFTAATPDRLQV